MSKAPYEERQMRWMCDTLTAALPGLDEDHLIGVYRRVVDTFLQESASWIMNKDFYSDFEGNVRLDFSTEGGELMTLLGVRHGSRDLVFVSNPRNHIRDTSLTRSPIWYSATPYPDVIVTHPAPVEDDVHLVHVRASLTLNADAVPVPDLPDWLFRRYKEYLRAGVYADLMLEPSKPYTDRGMGMLHSSNFKHGIAVARDQSKKSFGRHESEWAYPQGFMA